MSQDPYLRMEEIKALLLDINGELLTASIELNRIKSIKGRLLTEYENLSYSTALLDERFQKISPSKKKESKVTKAQALNALVSMSEQDKEELLIEIGG